MKILQVISSFPPAYSYGGALNVAYHLSKELVRIGHDVTVYTTDVFNSNSRLDYKENPEIMDGITIYRFRNLSNYLSRKNLTCAPSMFFFLKNQIKNFDIIHFHEYRSFQAFFAYYYTQKNNIPYIIQAHGSVLPIFEKQGIKKLFDILWGDKILKDASKLVAVSNVEKDQYLKMGLSEDKIEIIPNGIDMSEYEKLPERGKFRKKYGFLEDEKIILYLGRIHKIKGIDFLIDAYSQVIEELPHARLVIAGPDDGYLSTIREQIQQLNLNSKPLITGPLYGRDKLAAYVDADVLVYPGIFEIFGLVPFEAIMCGTPVIVADDCGCGEIIKEANCGYLVKYGKIDGLRDRLVEVLNDTVQSNLFVKNGQEFIKNNLSWSHIIGNLERIYMECISLSHGRNHEL